MSVVAFIQARMASTRLPGKVLRPLAGRPVLSWVVRAATEAGCDVVVATTTDPGDDVVAELCERLEVPAFRGHPDDVLRRYVDALEAHPSDPLVRLTADCPLLDPAVIVETVAGFAPGLDYVSNLLVPHLPLGLSVEVAAAAALRRADREATGVDRVHVTSYLYREPGRFSTAAVITDHDAPGYRVTLDTAEDLAALEAIVAVLGDAPPAVADVIDLLDHRPDIVAINAEVRQKAIEDG